MGRLVPENLKQRIRDASDIVDVVGAYVPLKRAGRAFKARCPFHQEKTPSFHVNPDLQIYKCFGCGAGGDVFKFVQEMEKFSFPEALAMLAERAGIPLAYDEADRDEARRWREGKQLLYRMHEFARRFFQEKLASEAGEHARVYLAHRGLSEAMVERFGIGYAPDSWDALTLALRGKKARTRLLLASGLCAAREEGSEPYDRFRDRLMFPITDAQGRVIAFGGRALSDESGPKYLNSPETPLFQKGRTLYGLAQAREGLRREKRAILMEGYTDVVMAAQHSFENAVATLGTALSREHVSLLARYADELFVVFDADRAGAAAAERGLDLLLEGGLSARVVTLPGGLDPCDLLRERGADAFREALAAGSELFEFKLDRACAERNLAEPRDLARAARELMETAAAVRDPVVRALLRKRAAERLGVPEETLKIPARRAPREEPAARRPAPPASQRARAEREMIRMALHVPEIAALYVRAVDPETLEDGACAAADRELRRQFAEREGVDAHELLNGIEDPEHVAVVVDLVGTGPHSGERLTAREQWDRTWRGWQRQRLTEEMRSIERELIGLKGLGDAEREVELMHRTVAVKAEVDRLDREALGGRLK